MGLHVPHDEASGGEFDCIVEAYSTEKKNTKYRLAIPVMVLLACTLFKLSHDASLFICSKIFAIGRSTISLVLREVVQAINVMLRSEIAWPIGERLLETEATFHELCGLLGVVGAIDGTHVSICKPWYGCVDYFYFKSGGYILNCQVVVDSKKRFLDLFLEMLGSTNDARYAWYAMGCFIFLRRVLSLFACRFGISSSTVANGTS